MEKSQQLSRKTWKLLAKNLIVLAVLVVATIVGVLSWFTADNSATASGINIVTDVPEGLEIAIKETGIEPSESDWVNGSVTLSAADPKYSFLSNLNISEITGDGILFIKPYLKQSGSVAIADTSRVWSVQQVKVNENVDYVSFDLHIRTKHSGKTAVLKSSTYFGPLKPNEDMTPEDGISSNSVIGAARMSIVNENKRKLLWIPAPHLYYRYDKLETNVVNVYNDEGLVDSQYKKIYSEGQNGTYNHQYYTIDRTRNIIKYGTVPDKSSIVTANNKKDYTLHEDVSVADLTEMSGGFYHDKVHVNLWIEGEDPESRAAQVGGEFKVELSLDLKNAN